MTFEITPPIKNLIAENIPLHDIIQGVVLNDIIAEQQFLSEADDEDKEGSANYEYHRGYTDAMQKVYGLVYSLIFEKEDQLRGVKNGN
jgi:hypothetical protein